MDIDLRTLFTYNAVVQTLQSLPPLLTPALDIYYPESRRGTHPLPTIGMDEVTDITKTMPVVRRGAPSTPITGSSEQISYIEPQPIRPSIGVSGNELNNLKVLLALKGQQGANSIETWRAAQIERLRRAVRATTEALSVQSLSGSISYPMRIEGGAYTTYTVTFGTILSETISTKWDNQAKTLDGVLGDLIALATKVKSKGYGTQIRYEAGVTAYLALAKMVIALQNDNRITASVGEASLNIAGFVVNLNNGSYMNPQTGASVDNLGAKKIRAIDLAAPFTLKYCALDDIESGLVALPFFPKAVLLQDPSQWKLIGESKPLPIPVPNAICEATAIS